MKNIHILPTDKPSRLHEYDYLSPMGLSKEPLKWRLGRNIYITNDEDINENDYIITKEGKLVQVSYLLSKDLQGASKVVLTTDQDLIKEGVQHIDDEFLEWFVKNPSCEEVEVDYKITSFIEVTHPSDKISTQYIKKLYKIIIPKEGTPQFVSMCENTFGGKTKIMTAVEFLIDWMKKNQYFIGNDLLQAVEQAKEIEKQQERMYSEEEVIELLTQRSKHFSTKVKPFNELLLKQDLEWFEQFKKK